MAKEPFVTVLDDSGQYQRLVDGIEQSCGLKAGRVHLEAGQECGVHTTGGREEVLVFLAGTGVAYLGENGEKQLDVGAGKIAYIPPETIHNIKNNASEPLIYVFCVTPVK